MRNMAPDPRRVARHLGLALWPMLALAQTAGCEGELSVDAGHRDAGHHDAGLDGDTPARPDASPADGGRDAGGCRCDDGIECTRDRCTDQGCAHEPVHSRCAPGSFCGATGCGPGAICAVDADCPTDENACTAAIRCDLARRQCTWDILDGDGDGHAPRVCGGLDCADASSEIGPHGVEVCNGRDDDCDGTIDGASADIACGSERSCVDGACICPDEQTFCGESLGCRTLSGDPLACGTCETACTRRGAVCDAGACGCPADSVECPGACAVLSSDRDHCGACGNACPVGATCSAGRCACPAGTSLCGGRCVALSTDPTSCGACDLRCLDGATCSAGACSTSNLDLRGFQSQEELQAAGLETHPSGDFTLLLGFRRTLDELPLRGIAGSSAGAFLSRRSSTGAERWSRLFESPGAGGFLLGGSPEREDVAVVGRISGTLDFGDGPITVVNSLAIARYDGAGALSWLRIVTSSDPTRESPIPRGVVMHPNGDVTVLASIASRVSFGGSALDTPSCCSGSVVARYAGADGAHLASWTLPVTGTGIARANSLRAGPDGSVVLGGRYHGGAAVFGTSILPGPEGAFVATYDGRGSATAAFAVPEELSDYFLGPAAFDVAPDGDVFLAGNAMLLARYSPTGALRWALPPTVGSAAATYGVRATRGGDVLVHGFQQGRFDFGGGPLSAYGTTMVEYRGDGTFVRARALPSTTDRPTAWIDHLDRAASGAWIAMGRFASPSLTVQGRTLALTAPALGTIAPVGAFVLTFDP